MNASLPCPICGGTEFENGRLTASGAADTFFVGEGRNVGDFFLQRRKGDVAARMCRKCGRLDLFVVDFSD